MRMQPHCFRPLIYRDRIRYPFFWKNGIQKQDGTGGATLEGAEYTVRYYDTYSETDPAEAGMIPKYTGVFRTDVSGKVMMDETHKVSGDGCSPVPPQGLPSCRWGPSQFRKQRPRQDIC